MADNQLQINIGADTRSLEQGLQRATTAVEKFDKTVNQSAAASGKAGLALSNLGRVASDAPFGFIAIQNNIEPLLQSFQSLSKESGGAGGALKALGASLAGPTGILLGFSLVSSAITVAIQKYGSLGAAIKAITGTQTELDKQFIAAQKNLDKYNETLRTSVDIARQEEGSVAGQIARVQALSKIASDQTASYENRNAALRELSGINKAYFGDLKIEDGLVKGLTDSVNNYTQSIIASAKAKGFEAEISKLAPLIAEQEALLNNLAKARNNVVESGAQPLPGIGKAIFTETQIATAAYNKQLEVVTKLKDRSKGFEDQLAQIVGKQTEQRIISDKATESQKRAADAQIASASATKKNNAELERQAEIDRKRIERLDRLMETRPTFAPIAGFNLVPEIDQVALSDIEGQVKLSRAKIEGSLAPLKSIGAQIINTIPKAIDPNFRIIPPGVSQSAIDAINNIKENISLVSSAFDTVLSPAIDGAFNAIANGQSVIESLKGSLKSLLVQLAANAAKALLLKAALSFVPGSAGIIGGGLLPGGGGASGILGALLGGGGGLPRLTGAAAPTFTGVSGFGGGLQLAGQVVFTQRGTDLVGVLNQSNARINRVG